MKKHQSLYRKLFQIPAKQLVDRERSTSLRLIGILLIMGGLIQGYLIMDFAFDIKLWVETYSEEACYFSFVYYTTILNNRFVNIMTLVAILSTHSCSYYGWVRNIVRKRYTETDLSLAFRSIFLQTCSGTIIYASCIVPRYLIFIDDFRDASDPNVEFDPDMVKDWGWVIVCRVIIMALNINMLISLFKLLPLLVYPPTHPHRMTPIAAQSTTTNSLSSASIPPTAVTNGSCSSTLISSGGNGSSFGNNGGVNSGKGMKQRGRWSVKGSTRGK